MRNLQNDFVWHDLLTGDVDEAMAFYGDVIGLTFAQETSGYKTANAQGFEMGGIMKAPDYLEKMPPFWSGYVATPSADASCDAVAKRGGVIFREPWGIDGVLRMAVVADPTGGFFNLMQGLDKQGEKPRPPLGSPGSIGWSELRTDDPEAALDFYCHLFGWTKGDQVALGGGETAWLFQINSRRAGAMRRRDPSMMRPMWQYHFIVNDLERAADRITALGGRLEVPPSKSAFGHMALSAVDPHGGSFHVMSA